ncbi:MAG: GGDEF domain-containing protein [Leptolyngbya sp. SIOISBB]|nr:GGDEF domain-containing protein [Leptolyngbya sp. SIOISBB]
MLHTDETFIRRTALTTLAIAVISAGLATLIHYWEPDPYLIDLVIPPLMFLVFSFLWCWLYRRPESLPKVMRVSLLTIFLGGSALPAWMSLGQAIYLPDVTLVDRLPPMSSFPMAIIVIMFIFATPQTIINTAVVVWALVSLPVLIYLITHPIELWSPRGLEMAVTLGPITAIVSTLVPFHRVLQQRLTSLQDERALMQVLSERDSLTHLYNRRAAEEFLSICIADAEPSDGVILFDIDHFKRINDTYGHQAGDAVLVAVAMRCSQVLRKNDCLARWGGEEFLVGLRHVGAEVIERIAEELRLAIASEKIEPAGSITASFGVSLVQPTDTIESLLQRVDQAMYAAKASGRNRVMTDKSLS